MEDKMSQPNFWDDPALAQKISQDLNDMKDSLETYRGLVTRVTDTYMLCELGIEEDDNSILQEVEDAVAGIETDLEHLQLSLMLGGEYDSHDAILMIHPGAGGTEAQDWAQMLLRMYVRWAEKNGFKLETLDILPGDEAGIKSVTVMVKGKNAYGYLKSEKGVHRLVRISPFDANARRHTSFAAVDILPQVDDDVTIEINPVDLKVDTYRASGAGGQHINKTDSAVRITHLPSGVIVQCQNERSQIQNRATCMQLLKAKLFELELRKQEEKKAEIAGEYQAIEWGSQIRSYVFHPYSLVKDHRTGYEIGNSQAVMDGELDGFIQAYLRSTMTK